MYFENKNLSRMDKDEEFESALEIARSRGFLQFWKCDDSDQEKLGFTHVNEIDCERFAGILRDYAIENRLPYDHQLWKVVNFFFSKQIVLVNPDFRPKDERVIPQFVVLTGPFGLKRRIPLSPLKIGGRTAKN